MFVSSLSTSRYRSALRLSALSAALTTVAALQPALAQGTHLWTQSRVEEFEKGTPRGVALSSDGYLREAPALSEVLTTPSTFVWSGGCGKKRHCLYGNRRAGYRAAGGSGRQAIDAV